MLDVEIARKWLWEDLPKVTYFLEIQRDIRIYRAGRSVRSRAATINIWLNPNRGTSLFRRGFNSITLGLRSTEDREILRKQLIHELLHFKGANHNKHLSYTSNWKTDTLTEATKDWIFHAKTKPIELEYLLSTKRRQFM